MKKSENNGVETVVFGGGCFWCTEAVFKMLKGVTKVVPGYAGGTKPNPTYYEVVEGDTGYVEVVSVTYDSSQVDFNTLLTIFFASHDPTTLNRQGNDVGPEYRSVVFYTNDNQKEMAEKFIADLNSGNAKGDKIVTTVEPLSNFYEAEDYHKDYYERNKNEGYCQIVINPKLEKIQRQYADLLKDIYKN